MASTEAKEDSSHPSNEPENTTASVPAPPSDPAPVTATHAAGEDSDPDFDDLDDVLDQFSANAPSASTSTSQAAPASSGPGRPESSVPATTTAAAAAPAHESEDQFLARFTQEMSAMMSNMEKENSQTQSSPEDLAKMSKELEDFTLKMEAEGIKPEDLLKAVLGEQAATAAVAKDNDHQGTHTEAAGSSSAQPSSTFEDTIRRTMERMEDSSNKATSAAAQGSSEEDLLANLMKSLGESGGGGDGDGDMSKMLLGMMEQLTNKEMLYEPMEELNQKFPAWLEANKGKLSSEDYGRYSRQRDIVKEIVGKFEEKTYTDDDPACREFIWEKMQKMQEQGSPPEDLVQNPMPGMNPSELDEGCPTQ